MNNRKIILPFIIAVAIVTGMFLQRKLSVVEKETPSKLSYVLDLIKNNYVEKVSLDSLSDDVIPQILEKLDAHSSYISSDEYKEMNEDIMGSFEGIGVQFSIQNDTIVVVQVISGGPSEKMNIKAGDRIISADDSVIAGIGITNEKTIKLLKGPKGTKVKVGIKRHGIEEVLMFDVVRGTIPVTSIDVAYMIDDNTGYIKISRFAYTTHREFLTEVKKLKEQGVRNLLIDLRENGGGLLQSVIDLSNEFLEKGDTIVFTKGRNTPAEYNIATGNGSCRDLKVVVIIDEFSASASEIFAGAIQDNDRGLIVGRRSYGKGVVNQDFILPDSSILRLTVQKFYTPSGRCIQKSYNGHLSDYRQEIVDRYINGEMIQADSIKILDSLKYTTRSGRVVYGGGGIVPDVFVAIDTTTYSNTFMNLTSREILFKYAFDFTDNHRDTLSKLGTVEKVVAYYNKTSPINKVLQYAKQKGVECSNSLSESEQEFMSKTIQCYIVRDIFGNAEFYRLLNNDDKMIKTAVEQIEK